MNAPNQANAAPGFVSGRHYTAYVDHVKELRRQGDEVPAEKLLLRLVEATEAEAREEGWGVAPWYYEQLAISYRKRGNIACEIAILERFVRQQHASGVLPPQLLKRLEKARQLGRRG
jgi:hypothetical protein